MVVALGVVQTGAHGQSVRNRNGQVDTSGILAVVGVDERTLFIVVVKAHVVVDLACLAGNGCIVVLDVTQLEAVVDPVEVVVQELLGIAVAEHHG